MQPTSTGPGITQSRPRRPNSFLPQSGGGLRSLGPSRCVPWPRPCVPAQKQTTAAAIELAISEAKAAGAVRPEDGR